MPGTAKWAPRPLVSRPSISGPCARIAICGASKISRRSPSAIPNTPLRASPMRRRRPCSASRTPHRSRSSPASRRRANASSRTRTKSAPNSAPPRLLESRDGQNHRRGAGRGRPPAGKHLRFRPGHHRRRARQAPPGRAARARRQGQEAARSRRLIPAMPEMRLSVSPALRPLAILFPGCLVAQIQVTYSVVRHGAQSPNERLDTEW